MLQLTTERLILRLWAETDAGDLYRYAKDDRVGPIAGWPPHSSVDDSAEIIRTVFSAPETYAVCLKEDNRAIGSIGLMIGARSDKEIPDTEGEIGYWIGVPFWGKGLIPEAIANPRSPQSGNPCQLQARREIACVPYRSRYVRPS